MRKALAGSIREPAMRINMMRLYASMVKSARNTELILSGRFAGITEEDAGGNYDIKGTHGGAVALAGRTADRIHRTEL